MSPHPWRHYDRTRPESVWRAIEDIRVRIDEMQTADEIAAAVAAAVKKEHALGLTVLQKTAAGIASGVVVAAALVDLVKGLH